MSTKVSQMFDHTHSQPSQTDLQNATEVIFSLTDPQTTSLLFIHIPLSPAGDFQSSETISAWMRLPPQSSGLEQSAQCSTFDY